MDELVRELGKAVGVLMVLTAVNLYVSCKTSRKVDNVMCQVKYKKNLEQVKAYDTCNDLPKFRTKDLYKAWG